MSIVRLLLIGSLLAASCAAKSILVDPGDSLRFHADAAVTWSASAGSITPEGLWVAPQTGAEAVITATGADESDAMTVMIAQAPPPPPPPDIAEVDILPVLVSGETLSFDDGSSFVAPSVVEPTVVDVPDFGPVLVEPGIVEPPPPPIVETDCAAIEAAGGLIVAPGFRLNGAGTCENPYDLDRVAGPVTIAQPGMEFWFLPGHYSLTDMPERISGSSSTRVRATIEQFHFRPKATPDNKITYRCAGTWPMSQCVFGFPSTTHVNSGYLVIRDFVFDDEDFVQRTITQTGSFGLNISKPGMVCQSPGIELINNWSRNNAGGIDAYVNCSESLIYGNFLSGNGWTAPDRDHGNGFYLQHSAPEHRIIRHNVALWNYAHGAHTYGTGAATLRNMDFTQNVFANNSQDGRNMIFRSEGSIGNILVDEALTWHNEGVSSVGLELDVYPSGFDALTLTNSRFFAQRPVRVTSHSGGAFTNVTAENNFVSSEPIWVSIAAQPWFTIAAVPDELYIWPNERDPNRAWAVVYNGSQVPSIAIDPGWTVYDAQCLSCGPVGDSVLPMTLTEIDGPEHDLAKYVHSDSRFGVFLLVRN